MTLPLRKREDNREYKVVSKVERYSSTRLYVNVVRFIEPVKTTRVFAGKTERERELHKEIRNYIKNLLKECR